MTHSPPPGAGATGDQLLRQLERHARLRWLGVGLLFVSVPATVTLAVRIALGTSPLGQVFLCLGGVLAPLSAFGTNNDTAVHAMRELARLRALPTPFRAELARERERRPTGLADVHASPKAAFLLPVVAIGVVCFVYYRAGIIR